ncbi:hypothetical protein WN51_01765 [Melipona quadrifasciata]|uniref:Uncharacterized protein n=1 Tax=Melipona quadrifasciata TaxID=166423 RepID=A0A0M8ZZX2_9HYME|nr:hypothetical protein WN51_01765 [Melipona quadrifasciata]
MDSGSRRDRFQHMRFWVERWTNESEVEYLSALNLLRVFAAVCLIEVSSCGRVTHYHRSE